MCWVWGNCKYRLLTALVWWFWIVDLLCILCCCLFTGFVSGYFSLIGVKVVWLSVLWWSFTPFGCVVMVLLFCLFYLELDTMVFTCFRVFSLCVY